MSVLFFPRRRGRPAWAAVLAQQPPPNCSPLAEALSRCSSSYGGIVDNPAAPSPENLLIEQKSKIAGALGWRKDVMDVIGKKGDLEMPMLRFVSGLATEVSIPFVADCLPSSSRSAGLEEVRPEPLCPSHPPAAELTPHPSTSSPRDQTLSATTTGRTALVPSRTGRSGPSSPGCRPSPTSLARTSSSTTPARSALSPTSASTVRLLLHA